MADFFDQLVPEAKRLDKIRKSRASGDSVDGGSVAVEEKPRTSIFDDVVGGPVEAASTIASEAGKGFLRFGVDAVKGAERLGVLAAPSLALKASGRRSIGEFLDESVTSKLSPPEEGKAATVGQAIGGIAPSFVLGATAGLSAMTATFASSGFGQAFDEADRAGVSPIKTWAFALSVAGLSLTERFQVGRTLSALDSGTGGFVRKFIERSGSTTIKKIFQAVAKNRAGRAILTGLEAAPGEAFQETILQRIPENVLAKAFSVDDDRSILDGTRQSTILGLIGGQIGGTAIGAFRGPSQSRAIDQLQVEEPTEAPVSQSEPTVEPPPVPDAAPGQPAIEQPTEVAASSSPDVAAPSVPTVDDIPTAISSSDITKPVGQRAKQSTDSGTNAQLKPGDVVTSPEGTRFTTPRQEDLRAQTERIVGVTVPSEFKRSGQEDTDIARKEGFVSRALFIADAVNTAPSNKPFVLDSIRQAGLRERLNEIDIESDITLNKIGGNISQQDINELNANIDRLRHEFDQISRALDFTGSEQGRALRGRRFAIDRLFNLFTLERRAKAKKGADLDPQENAVLQQGAAKLKEIENKLINAQKVIKDLEAQLDLRKRRPGKKKRAGREAAQERRSLIDDVIRIARAGCVDG